jgi:RNase P subunit RPR2
MTNKDHTVTCSCCGDKPTLPYVTIIEEEDEDGETWDSYELNFCKICAPKITQKIQHAFDNQEYNDVLEILCDTCGEMLAQTNDEVNINPRRFKSLPLAKNSKDIKKLSAHIRKSLK